MTPVIERLKERIPSFELGQDGLPLIPRTIEFYRAMVPHHPYLNLEYSILTAHLRKNLEKEVLTAKEQQETRQQLIDLLILCQVLEQIHLHYLAAYRDVTQLQNQKAILYAIITNTALPKLEEAEFSLTHYIRFITLEANTHRVLLSRTRRFLNLMAPILSATEHNFHEVIRLLDKYTNAFFLHLGWVFYLPRLLVNLFLLFKHILPGSWMSEEEKALGVLERLRLQVQRKWFELTNDLVWGVTGILTAFVLVGSLAPIAIYVGLAAFVFDIFAAALRSGIELNRLYALKDEYTAMLQGATNEEKMGIQEYLSHLDERISFEKYRAALAVTGATIIFAVMCLTIPGLAVSPLILFISATFLLLLWGVNFGLTQLLESNRPQDAITPALEKKAKASTLGFFAPKASADSRVTSVDDLMRSPETQNFMQPQQMF